MVLQGIPTKQKTSISCAAHSEFKNIQEVSKIIETLS